MKAATREDLSYQYFCFYVADYLRDQDVEVLSMNAEACWLRLCAKQWLSGRLPALPEQLRRLTKATESEWTSIWLELEPLFPIDTDGARRNVALQEQRLEREAYLETKRAAGKQGGRGKKKHPETTDESNTKARAEANAKQQQEQNKSTAKADGIAEAKHTSKHTPKQTESLELESVATPLSPPPDGGGASPAPPQKHVLSFASAEQRSDAFHVQLNNAVLEIPAGPARAAVKELLDTQRVPSEKWSGWVSRIAGWQQGLATSGMRPVSWEAIAEGLEELLLTNPVGQPITPLAALTFVEKAEQRQRQTGAAGTAREQQRSGRGTTDRTSAIAFARAGDPDAITYCDAEGIDYRSGAVA